MTKREKVIEALECRKNADKRCGNPCEDTGLCHYATVVRDLDGEIYRPFIRDRERICADAISLLKEQEAVKPIAKEDDMYECICGAVVGFDELDAGGITQIRFKYCQDCGRKVKWEC